MLVSRPDVLFHAVSIVASDSSSIDMEGTSSFFLQLIVVCAFVCLACGQSCPSQQQTSAKFTVRSQRNQTGHWISQVMIEQGAANNTVTTSPWTAEVEHNTASCNGVESVQLVATLTAPPLRAPGYELHRGVGYYKIHSDPKTWHEARLFCAQEGGHLAIINSEEESKVLQSMFAPVAAKLKGVWVFIGFHDLYNEGQYLTVFDEPLSSSGFYRWASSNQPDNAGGNDTMPGEDCGSMHTNGGLNDLHCSARVPFICEQELW
jgi:hypothetical protein